MDNETLDGSEYTDDDDYSFCSNMSDDSDGCFQEPCGGIIPPQDEIIEDLIDAIEDTTAHIQQIFNGFVHKDKSSLACSPGAEKKGVSRRRKGDPSRKRGETAGRRSQRKSKDESRRSKSKRGSNRARRSSRKRTEGRTSGGRKVDRSSRQRTAEV